MEYIYIPCIPCMAYIYWYALITDDIHSVKIWFRQMCGMGIRPITMMAVKSSDIYA